MVQYPSNGNPPTLFLVIRGKNLLCLCLPFDHRSRINFSVSACAILLVYSNANPWSAISLSASYYN